MQAGEDRRGESMQKCVNSFFLVARESEKKVI